MGRDACFMGSDMTWREGEEEVTLITVMGDYGTCSRVPSDGRMTFRDGFLLGWNEEFRKEQVLSQRSYPQFSLSKETSLMLCSGQVQ